MQAAKELTAVPGVQSSARTSGARRRQTRSRQLHRAVDQPDRNADTPTVAVQRCRGYPGLYRDLLTYLRERIKEVLTGAAATVVVRIFGPDLDGLNVHANQVASAIKGIGGVADLKVQPMVLVPQLAVRFQPQRAQIVGVTPGEVRKAATTLVQGTKVAVYEDQKVSTSSRGARGVDNIDAHAPPLQTAGGGPFC